MSLLFWVWLACGPVVWYVTEWHTIPFDPLRAWLMVGWLGRIIAARRDPVTGPAFKPIPKQWLAIHAVVLLAILPFDMSIFTLIASHGLFFMPHPLAGHLFTLGDGLTELAILLVVFVCGGRAAAKDGAWGAFNACVNVQILKTLFGRAFPTSPVPFQGEFVGPLGLAWHESFPSGHTTSAMAVATVLAHHYPKARWVFYVLGASVGLATVVTRHHWLGDAYAGMLLGWVSGQQAVQKYPNLLLLPGRQYWQRQRDAAYSSSPR